MHTLLLHKFMMQNYGKTLNIPIYLIGYRIHPESITQSRLELFEECEKKYIVTYIKICKYVLMIQYSIVYNK
jgi:hypothetical protein